MSNNLVLSFLLGIIFLVSCNDNKSIKNTNLLEKDLITISPKKGFNVDTIIIDNSQAIKVSVWRKGGPDAYLVFKNKDRGFISEIRKASFISDNNWERISYIFRLPPFIKKDTVIISIYNNGNEKPISFNRAKIEIIENEIPDSKLFIPIELKIDSVEVEKLLKYRHKALNDKLIKKRNKKWVNALFVSDTDTFKVKIRLKGDWLDHIQSNKWSLRIKIKGDNYWQGFKTFSLQNPDSKFVMDEYIYHAFLIENKILSPRYGFVPLKINGVFVGIYAYEEHFTRQLVESQERREGPILKFDEEPFWAVNYNNLNTKKKILPIFNVAKILPFDSKRIRKKGPLRNNFITAQNLLYTLKETDRIKNIIDVERFAEFYSIVDLMGAYHSLIWHNIRFYYNPVSNLLEPIAFDGYTESGIYSWTQNKMTFECCRTGGLNPDSYFIMKLFKNKSFTGKYFQFSKKINNEKALNSFFKKKQKEIELYEQMLNIDYPDIKYNYNFLRQRAYANDSIMANKKMEQITNYKVQRSVSENYNSSLIKKYINVFPTDDSTKYLIENFNSFDVFVIAYSKKKNNIEGTQNLKVDAYKESKKGLQTLTTNKKIKYIYVRVKKDTIRVKINKFVYPEIYYPEKDIFQNLELYVGILKVKNDTIIFNTGNYIIDKAIIIPKGYKVIINSNTNVDFINESYILSYSPIYIYGTSNKPVNFFSSDESAKGITVIKSKEESLINYLNLKKFNTLSQSYWKLTGAITFYNSDVLINNMTIIDNKCEDALNIVNSKYSIKNCRFKTIFSDAFDSDFSIGTVENCVFEQIKNDAIDFSGSQSDIINCQIKGTGDKGISAGEKSNIKINTIKISNSNIAFASKDKSKLSVNSSFINTCKYAFASYVKKKEFGASELIVKDVNYSNIENLLLIDKNCSITIDGKEKIGRTKLVIK